jgi:hypothetical protein
VAASFVLVAAVVGWFFWRSEERHWARETAIPKIAILRDEDKSLAAFLLAKQAINYLPEDKQLRRTLDEMTQATDIDSSPEGATVEIQDYLLPNSAWYRVGTTPLKQAQVPKGYFRWKVSKTGIGSSVTAPDSTLKMMFALDAQAHAPGGMVAVSGGTWENYVVNVGFVGPVPLSAYYVDRYEVTNREYQKFVDSGGYEKQDYWHEKFAKDGRELSWEEAMAMFRDGTGRHGPATWQAGHFPEGQGDYPVSGVSWYEASAYAAFVGKSLPTVAQWYQAISADAAGYMTKMSNIGRQNLLPVGSLNDVGPFGSYDLAGNVREWIFNSINNRRFILGGAWDSQPYLYVEPEALSPFD